MQPAPTRPSRIAALAAAASAGALVIVAWASLTLVGLDMPFHTKGEPREAVVVADIVHNGRWILPRRNAVEMPAKPPLFHWLGALTSRAQGAVSEASVRLPSALLSGASAVLLFCAVTLLCGARAALIAALVMLSSFEWLRAATSARVDMTLAFGLTAAFTGLLMLRAGGRQAWLVLVYAGTAWAALAKGPVGIALPVLHVVLLCAIDRSFAFARQLHPLRALIIVGMIAGAWYGLAIVEGGREFFAKQILDENVYRFLGSAKLTGGHRHSSGYLASMLLIGLLPWTIFLPSALIALWRDRATLSRRDPRLFALTWALLVFAFYAVPASKRGVYLLPMYPALALLVGWWGDALTRGEIDARRLASVATGAAWILTALAGVLAITVGLESLGLPILSAIAEYVDPRAARDLRTVASVIQGQPLMLAALFAVAALGAVAAAVASAARRYGGMLSGWFVATAALAMTVRLVIMPGIASAQTRQHFVARIKALLPAPDDVAAYRHFDYGTIYYWGESMPVYRDPLTSDGPPYLLMSESQWAAVPARERRYYERVSGLDSGRAGNLGPMVLTRRIASGRAGAIAPPEDRNAP